MSYPSKMDEDFCNECEMPAVMCQCKGPEEFPAEVRPPHEKDSWRFKRLKELGVQLDIQYNWIVWVFSGCAYVKLLMCSRTKKSDFLAPIAFSECVEAVEAAIVRLGWLWSRNIEGRIGLWKGDRKFDIPEVAFDSRLEALDWILKEKEKEK